MPFIISEAGGSREVTAKISATPVVTVEEKRSFEEDENSPLTVVALDRNTNNADTASIMKESNVNILWKNIEIP